MLSLKKIFLSLSLPISSDIPTYLWATAFARYHHFYVAETTTICTKLLQSKAWLIDNLENVTDAAAAAAAAAFSSSYAATEPVKKPCFHLYDCPQ